MSRAFDLAYSTLKMRIISGTLRPGQHIDITALAAAIRVSTSPLREALCTLAAEGLLGSIKGSGFHVPALDFAGISDLLAWSDHLSSHCVRSNTDHRGEATRHDIGDHLSRVTFMFREIGLLAPNGEMTRALNSATLRLSGLYRIEPAFLPDAEDELGRIEDGLVTGSPTLSRQIHAFHQRRMTILPRVIRAARNGRE